MRHFVRSHNNSAILTTMKPCGGMYRLCFALLILAVSCYNSDDLRPALESTPELFGSPQFGVVNESFVRAYAGAGADNSMTGLFRGGDIVAILDRSIQQVKYMNEWNYWYQVRSGEKVSWIFGGDLELCDRELNAKTLSAQLKVRLFGS